MRSPPFGVYMKTLFECMDESKIIAIVRGYEKGQIIPIAQAVYDGGIRCIEITFDNSGEYSHEYCADEIKMLRDYFGDRMAIGAGTVLTSDQCKLAKDSGASFIVSPNTNPKIIEETKKLGMGSIPGAMTPSEIYNAHESGADFVKVYPSDLLGADYFRSVLAPLANIKLLAFGGIEIRNIRPFINAGAYGFGIGSAIIRKDSIFEESYSDITVEARKFMSLIR